MVNDDRPSPTPGRRSVVAGLAAAGAVPVLAACGAGGVKPATTKAGPLTKTSEIPVGGGKVFDSRKVVVTQPVKGEFKCFTAVCTHQGCLVAKVVDDVIQCPCHGSQFSAKDGSVETGPATRPLAAEKITVEGGEITLD